MDSTDSYISQGTDIVYEAEEFDSSDELPMHEWSSLNTVDIPEDNNKIICTESLCESGIEEVCTKYISISQTSKRHHLLYNYPAVKDPGIQDALLLPEKVYIYPGDGQELYIATCNAMGLAPIKSFIQSLFTEKVDLSYYCVNPKGVRPIAMAITDNNMVKVLNLTDNVLDDDACYHLGKMLIYNSTLEEINMSRCKIKSTGVQRLLKGIARNRTLKTLNLDRNELGDDGAEHVAKAVQEGLNVEQLDLSHNNISARGARALAEGFETPTRIVKLNLSWNNFIAEGPTSCLLAKLGEIETLQEINLSWNALTGARVGKAIHMLMKAPNLTQLKLNNNELTSDAITNLIGNIAKASHLITLDLSFNPLTLSDALKVIKKMKPASVRIRFLLMESIDVTSEFLEVLKEVKDKNKPNFFVTYGRVIDLFKPWGPDMRELVLKRADYLSKKSKKNQADLALIVFKLVKSKVYLMTEKDFTMLISTSKLDTDLVNTIIRVFAEPSNAENKKVNLNKIADYVKRLWPDKKLPNTPPPEPEVEPKITKAAKMVSKRKYGRRK